MSTPARAVRPSLPVSKPELVRDIEKPGFLNPFYGLAFDRGYLLFETRGVDRPREMADTRKFRSTDPEFPVSSKS
jgi:hypothetical protein